MDKNNLNLNKLNKCEKRESFKNVSNGSLKRNLDSNSLKGSSVSFSKPKINILDIFEKEYLDLSDEKSSSDSFNYFILQNFELFNASTSDLLNKKFLVD